MNDALTRRSLLTGSAALAASAMMQSAPALPQAAVAHSIKIGSLEVTILSDGSMDLPPSFMLPGRDSASVEALFKQHGSPSVSFRSEVNVAIVRSGTDVILVDTGAGPDFMPTLGKLPERMEAAGIKPDSVTKVIFTHAHADHLWGVIDPLGGDTYFEKAEHLMSAAEFAYWMQADVDTRVPDAFRGMAAGTHRRLKSLAPRIKQVRAGTDIAPGVQLVDTGGHTPGHMSVLVRSGGEQLLIGGDVLTQHIVSFAAPDWRWGPDMDPDKAIAARKKTLDQLAIDRIRLLGYHLPWPGVGRVEKAGPAYRYLQA